MLTRCRLLGWEIVEVAAEPGDHDLGRLRPRDRVGGVAGRFGLEGGEAPQLRPELARLLGADREACRERLLETGCGVTGPPQRRLEPGRDLHEPSEELRIDVALAQVRDCRKRLLGLRCDAGGLVGRLGGARRPAGELVGLVGERAATGIHLEQHRLRRLAREPELAALGVVAVALGRDHGSVPRVEQVLDRHEPDAVEQAQRGRVAGGELAERPRALDRRASRRVRARGRR